MTKSVAEKMGIKRNDRSVFIKAPEDALVALDLPATDLETKLSGEFDYIHFFVVSQKDFHEEFPTLKSHLKQTGSLWVSWPKSGQKNTDLNLKSVIKLGYDYGLVESKCLSINSTWSALKFTHPKKGKSYNNSYGELKRGGVSLKSTQQESDFPKVSKPALRALNGAGYFSREHLTRTSKAELSKLHGVGPKALGMLEQALVAKGLSFKKES